MGLLSASTQVRSLRARLLLVTSLVLVVFTAFALAVLDNAFRRNSESALRDSLQAQLYALLTVVEPGPDGALNFVEVLAEPRFAVAGSGLYAFIYDAQDQRVWNSVSALDLEAPETIAIDTGGKLFDRESSTDGEEFYVLRFGVAWDVGDAINLRYTFVVMESAARHDRRLRDFRINLTWWSALGTLLLLALQLLSLRWAMTPLTRMASEIRRVEEGHQAEVVGKYPKEISALTNSLNGLILSGRRALDRYRNSLGDLAHSLKTPLAVLRGAAEQADSMQDFRATVEEQVGRMQSIVDFQLRKAASSGGAVLIKPLSLRPVVEKIMSALDKVHHQRRILSSIEIESELMLAVDEGDLMEILGNILENAFKWCDRKVRFSASQHAGKVILYCDDDGPGIDPGEAEAIFERGVRADEQVPGQGIGLAVVMETVRSYNGSLKVESGILGGARFIVQLPAA